MPWVIVRACSALIKPPQHGTGQPKGASRPCFHWPRLARVLQLPHLPHEDGQHPRVPGWSSGGSHPTAQRPPPGFLAPWARDQASLGLGPYLYLLSLKMGFPLSPPHRVWEDPVRSHVILVRPEAGTCEGAINSRALPTPSALGFSSAVPLPGSPLVFPDPAPPAGPI